MVLFNSKSNYNQQLFYELSSNSEKLRNCFKSDHDLQDQAPVFEKTLNKVFHQAFQKIRGRKRKPENQEMDFFISRKEEVEKRN